MNSQIACCTSHLKTLAESSWRHCPTEGAGARGGAASASGAAADPQPGFAISACGAGAGTGAVTSRPAQVSNVQTAVATQFSAVASQDAGQLIIFAAAAGAAAKAASIDHIATVNAANAANP